MCYSMVTPTADPSCPHPRHDVRNGAQQTILGTPCLCLTVPAFWLQGTVQDCQAAGLCSVSVDTPDPYQPAATLYHLFVCRAPAMRNLCLALDTTTVECCVILAPSEWSVGCIKLMCSTPMPGAMEAGLVALHQPQSD